VNLSAAKGTPDEGHVHIGVAAAADIDVPKRRFHVNVAAVVGRDSRPVDVDIPVGNDRDVAVARGVDSISVPLIGDEQVLTPEVKTPRDAVHREVTSGNGGDARSKHTKIPCQSEVKRSPPAGFHPGCIAQIHGASVYVESAGTADHVTGAGAL